jgi:hypothetical protein
MKWKNLDSQQVQERARRQREDATLSGNVAGVAMPFAGVQRPVIAAEKRKKVKGG